MKLYSLFTSLTATALGLSLGAGLALAQTAAPELSTADLMRDGQQTVARDPALLTAKLAPHAVLAEGGAVLGPDVPVLWELFSLTDSGTIDARYTHDTGQPLLAAEPGPYILSATLDHAMVAERITLAADTTATPLLVLNAGLVQITPHLEAGGQVRTDARVILTTPDGIQSTQTGPQRIYVGAGDVQVRVTFDGVEMRDTVTVAAAATVTRDYTVAAGLAQVQILSNSAPLPIDVQARIDIFDAAPQADGRLHQVVFDTMGARAFSLPPGDYIAQGMVQSSFAQVPFSVQAGEIVSVPIALDNGTLVISAPESLSLAIYKLAPEAGGEPELLYYEWDQTGLIYGVPEGDYRVEVLLPSGLVAKLVTVAAGGRYEISFP